MKTKMFPECWGWSTWKPKYFLHFGVESRPGILWNRPVGPTYFPNQSHIFCKSLPKYILQIGAKYILQIGAKYFPNRRQIPNRRSLFVCLRIRLFCLTRTQTFWLRSRLFWTFLSDSDSDFSVWLRPRLFCLTQTQTFLSDSVYDHLCESSLLVLLMAFRLFNKFHSSLIFPYITLVSARFIFLQPYA